MSRSQVTVADGHTDHQLKREFTWSVAIAVVVLAVVGAVVYATRRRHIIPTSTAHLDDPDDLDTEENGAGAEQAAAPRRAGPGS